MKLEEFANIFKNIISNGNKEKLSDFEIYDEIQDEISFYYKYEKITYFQYEILIDAVDKSISTDDLISRLNSDTFKIKYKQYESQ